MKTVWLAIVLPPYALGLPMRILPGKSMQAYRNWAKRRSLRIIGEKVPNGRLQRLDPGEIAFGDFPFRRKKSRK